MWKKCLLRGAVSYCICATATLIVHLICTLCGASSMCVPAFIARVGDEMTATLLQPLLIALIGFAFGAGSILFEIERWSFLLQGAVHFAVTGAVWIGVEMVCFAPITPPAVVSFALSSAAAYAITWGAQYFAWRAQVRRLNKQIHRKNAGGAQ